MTPDLICDVGMHDGSDTAFYLAKGFRVVAIEANPFLCRKNALTFSDFIVAGKLVIENIAIDYQPGEVPFWINENQDDWSSLDQRMGERGKGGVEIRVRAVQLDEVIRRHAVPYYLKIDIEGRDGACVEAISRFPSLPRFVSVEATVRNFSTTMGALGYDRFKIINQKWHQSLACPNPSREGGYVNQRFTGHHSGPFGEETYGEWMTISEFEAERLRIERKQFVGSYHEKLGCSEAIFTKSWWDYHAALS